MERIIHTSTLVCDSQHSTTVQYVFKTDSAGLGYYLDIGLAALMEAGGVAPLRNREPDSAPAEPETEPDEAPKTGAEAVGEMWESVLGVSSKAVRYEPMMLHEIFANVDSRESDDKLLPRSLSTDARRAIPRYRTERGDTAVSR